MQIMDETNTIENMRAALDKCITGWKTDGSSPPNFVRETGLGTEVARVDVWLGGYQDVHHPIMIGWKARCGNSHQSSVLLVSDYDSQEAAVAEAKRLADEALKELQK